METQAGSREHLPNMVQERPQRRLTVILAADIAGYSRLMEEDEEGTLAALTAHLGELIEPCITEHQGRLVKTTGDMDGLTHPLHLT